MIFLDQSMGFADFYLILDILILYGLKHRYSHGQCGYVVRAWVQFLFKGTWVEG